MVNSNDADLMDRERRREKQEKAEQLSDASFKGNTNDRLMTQDLSTLRKLKTLEYKDSGNSDPLDNRYTVITSTRDVTRARNLKKTKEAHELKEKDDSGNASKVTGAASVPNFKSKRTTVQMNSSLKKKEGDKKITGKPQKFERMNAENYREVYLRRKRQQEEAALGGKNLTPDQLKKKAAETKKMQEQETMQRVRARDLYDQILWWRTQYGMGVYENYYVTGELARLEQEMNAIDPRFWP